MLAIDVVSISFLWFYDLGGFHAVASQFLGWNWCKNCKERDGESSFMGIVGCQCLDWLGVFRFC